MIIKAIQGQEIVIEKSENEVIITYDTEPHFYMALARGMGMKDGLQRIQPKVEKLGVMLDCSRNAVAKPEMLKQLIGLLVLTGYNYLELYTEETYELPGEPYFGYQRGRYTEKELREIVAFADIFGFEMVPCIQTLAHLKNLANWRVYYDHMDIDDILLVGDERTYQLVRKCIRYCKKVFHTKRINIGTDEAFQLGRGKYEKIHGATPKREIYLEHLKRVFQICKEEGVEPEFWGAELCAEDCPVEEVKKLFDGTQTPICYSYSVRDKEYYSSRILKLQACAGKTMFAGGMWKWIGFAPDNAYTMRTIDVQFEAVDESGVDNILMTAWGDGGDECSVYSVIPSMWYAANKLYPCEIDVDEVVRILTGYTAEEWMSCDKPNHVMPHTEKVSNAVKYILYNDFLIGLLDYHIPDHAGEVYAKLYEEFEILAQRESQFSYIFKSYAAVCKVLIKKATYSKRLYEAYHSKDKEQIKELMNELSMIKQDIKMFHDAFRQYWMIENKSIGFEISDTRIGGMMPRIDTVAMILNDYLKGHIEKIDELEHPRLDYWCGQYREWSGKLVEGERYEPVHNDWWTAYTVNHFRM